MTDIDWDLRLLKQMKGSKPNAQQQQNQADLMLQPITTQQNFKIQKKVFKQQKSPQKFTQKQQNSNLLIENPNLNQQSQKFRDYLNEKVQQLRKSKEINLRNQKKPIQQNKPQINKNSTLRSIINQEESKQKVTQKYKLQNNIKKSIEIQPHKKYMELPMLTPPLKPPNLKKNIDISIKQQKNKRKSTLDNHSDKVSKQLIQRERKKTPQSKNSFRIKRTSNLNVNTHVPNDTRKSTEISAKFIQKQSPIYQGKSKRMREQFMRLNEQERKLQQEIFNFHKETKHPLEMIMKKYQISSTNYQKYGITKEIEQQQNLTERQQQNNKISLEKKQNASLSKKSIQLQKTQKNSQTKIKQSNGLIALSPSKEQKQKKSVLNTHLEILNNLLNAKSKSLQKIQLKLEKNPYIKFLKQQPSDIQQQIEEDEEDIVEELPNSNLNKFSGKQFQSTYSSVMTDMKNKKWGLKQRITFETHRDSPQRKLDQKQSRTDNNFARLEKKSNQKLQNAHEIEQKINLESFEQNYKIQVNDKLKKLLFE